ncbi:MAG: Mov34/MPN/PAD-1 family protein [Planctomycetia bacterium]|nr:MAG: Mov34/MPN/PAD-1 family protein [Planctomycetia bacterium]
MSFSIKATIRAWLLPEHRLSCRPRLWAAIVDELERRGHHRHETGVFLLGVDRAGRREVTDSVFYDDLDSNAYSSGVCILHGDAFAKLWTLCRERQLSVVADVHTHPGAAYQSASDKANPMIATSGHIAIIVPDFARSGASSGELGVFEYRGQHQWTDRSGQKDRFFYRGFWS